MRVSKQRRKRYAFCDKLKKKLTEIMNHVIDVLAKPIEAWDRWIDRYDIGYNDGVDAVCEGAVYVVLDIYKDRHKVVKERCNHIEAVISEMELNYPELHAEVDSIEKALQEIRKQVK